MIYRLASSAVKGGSPAAVETGAAVVEPAVVELAVAVAVADCEQVCRVVACRIANTDLLRLRHVLVACAVKT
eukprot:1390157-Pleurochrysis_carterae.AAC.1